MHFTGVAIPVVNFCYSYHFALGHPILAATSSPHAFRSRVLRCLTIVVGCAGLAWGLPNLSRGEATDEFRDLESRLLQFETFRRPTAVATLASAAARGTSPCDTHAQRALLLLEIPLADEALQSGAVREYDERIRSLESRARTALGCAPRDSFVWLVLFGLETEHGVLDDRAFELLAMSYQTSPNEAWVAARRVALAGPVVLSAPEPMRLKILAEFDDLVSHGLVEMPARAYLRASAATRALLQSRIERLHASSQKSFADALQRLRS